MYVSHPGVTGDIYMDDIGDRKTNYIITDLNPKTGEFEVGHFLSFLMTLALASFKLVLYIMKFNMSRTIN